MDDEEPQIEPSEPTAHLRPPASGIAAADDYDDEFDDEDDAAGEGYVKTMRRHEEYH